MTAAGFDLDAEIDALSRGDRRAVAKALTRAEAGAARHADFFRAVFRRTGRAHVIGLTGVPGSGKSTLVTALTQALRAAGRRVGIVAVDPSSPFSGGSILGDRVRMGPLAGDEGVFVRSLATGGALGGLAAPCLDMVDVLDAAGFDVVLIETVGVGQDEVDIARAAETVVVVSAPGLGDGVQAIKAGVLEIADIHAVSKADRPDAGTTVADLEAMLGLDRAPRFAGWTVPVIATSAQTGQGVEALIEAADAHRSVLAESGEAGARRRERLRHRTLKTAEDLLRARLTADGGAALTAAVDSLDRGDGAPFDAARALLDAVPQMQTEKDTP
jgi:LAO/AO transport system kinase